FINTTTISSSDLWTSRVAIDAHTLPWSVRSEQRRPSQKEPPPGGLRRFSVLASLLLGHSPTAVDAPSSCLARTENRRNKRGRIYETGYLGPQEGDDGPPSGRVVAGSHTHDRVTAGPAPELRIERGPRGAEVDVAVAPKHIEAIGIPSAGMSQGAPGIDQVRHQRPLRTQLRLLGGHLRPTPVRVARQFGSHVRLREVGVGRIDLAIDCVHGPGNLGAFEVFLLKNN